MKILKTRISGFTLIELMIVIVIIGILGAVSMPTLNQQLDAIQPGIASSVELKDENGIIEGYALVIGDPANNLFNLGVSTVGSEWKIVDLKMDARRAAADFPLTNSGAPIPGHFDVKLQFNTAQSVYNQSFPLPEDGASICSSSDKNIVFALKVVVQKEDSEGMVITKTLWSAGEPFAKGAGSYVVYTLPCEYVGI